MSIHTESIQYDEPNEGHFKVRGPYETYDHERNWLLEGFSVEYKHCVPPTRFTVPTLGVTYVMEERDTEGESEDEL